MATVEGIHSQGAKGHSCVIDDTSGATIANSVANRRVNCA